MAPGSPAAARGARPPRPGRAPVGPATFPGLQALVSVIRRKPRRAWCPRDGARAPDGFVPPVIPELGVRAERRD